MRKTKSIFLIAAVMAIVLSIGLNCVGLAAGDGIASNVKRDEAAVLVVQFALDKDCADKLTDTSLAFADLPANSSAAGEINWATERGIIKGDGSGNFNPGKDVTGTEVLKMLLCAVGYGRNGEYTGAKWSTNVNADAAEYGLLEGAESYDASIPATREQIMAYISNAENQLPGIRTHDIRLLFTLAGYEDGKPVGTVTADMTDNSDADFKWSESAVDVILTKAEVAQLYTTNNDDATTEFDVTESTAAVTLMINAGEKYGYIDCMAGETATDIAVVDDVTVPEGATLWVAEGSVLTIAEGATLTIDGTLENYGKIIIDGKLINNGQLSNNGELEGIYE